MVGISLDLRLPTPYRQQEIDSMTIDHMPHIQTAQKYLKLNFMVSMVLCMKAGMITMEATHVYTWPYGVFFMHWNYMYNRCYFKKGHTDQEGSDGWITAI